MFNNQRYITRGISARIPITTQLFLWELIEELSVEKDYAQFFHLSVENGKQKIVHIQERPEYKRTHTLDIVEPVNEKVFVIDDETHSTMLLAEEY